MKFIIRILLSIFIIYHLIVILVYPNPISIPGRMVTKWTVDYANLFNLNTTWQFFSPDPTGHVFLRYEVLETEDPEEEPKEHLWPPARGEFKLHDFWFRLVYHSRHMIMSHERMEANLLPWLCRKHPEAKQIVLKGVVEELPTIELMQQEGKPFADAVKERTWSTLTRECGR